MVCTHVGVADGKRLELMRTPWEGELELDREALGHHNPLHHKQLPSLGFANDEPPVHKLLLWVERRNDCLVGFFVLFVLFVRIPAEPDLKSERLIMPRLSAETSISSSVYNRQLRLNVGACDH
jgi:hypothetical protein